MLITLFLLIVSALDVLFFFLPNSNFDPKAVRWDAVFFSKEGDYFFAELKLG